MEDNSISIKINGKHYDEMSIVFKDLLAMNITYVSYILISSDNTIYRFSTDEKWLYNIFLEKNLILHCPLRKIVYSGLSRIISWSSLTLNKMESLVMSSRYDHNHKNGMTFSNNLNIFQGFKEVIAIATNRNDLFIENDYFLNIIKYKYNLIRLRKIAVSFIQENKQFSYAKQLEQQQLYSLDKSRAGMILLQGL